MGSRESYDEALAQRLALLRAELTGERAAAEAARARAERAGRGAHAEPAVDADHVPGEPASEPASVGVDDVAVATIREPGRHASRRFPSVAARVPTGLLAPGAIAVVAVLLALGVGVVAWLTLRSQSQELPMAVPAAGGLATPVAVSGGATGPTASGPAAGGASTEVVVHVAGKVRRPGIVVLAAGARVVDAVTAAGGARPGVDLAGINLARVLVDGEQILVGTGPAPAAAGGGTGAGGAGVAGGGKVNLNTASESELEELPGVGPVTAAAIVTFREEHGAFTSVDQLLDVSGIGEATLAEIAPRATV